MSLRRQDTQFLSPDQADTILIHKLDLVLPRKSTGSLFVLLYSCTGRLPINLNLAHEAPCFANGIGVYIGPSLWTIVLCS